ncbi:MAG: hypothetical protein SGILL_004442 [Bacillariaceae sp.]
MKFPSFALKTWLLAAVLSTANAFTNNNGFDSSMDGAMSQYEAALKTASKCTTGNNENLPKVSPPTYSDVTLLQQIDEQHEAMEKYEAALKAAFLSTAAAPGCSHPVTTVTNNMSPDAQSDTLKTIVNEQQTKLNEGQCWDSLTQEIEGIISDKETASGKPLSEDVKDEIIATAIAGSVLGTAVGSPLLIGAALGYAGTQILQGENGNQNLKFLGTASQELMSQAAEQANAALTFTKEQWEEEQDLSAVSKKILKEIEANAQSVHEDIQAAPSHLVENLKTTVESEDFKQLPNRTFKAFRNFLGSDEVKTVSKNAMQALRDGLESEELKALQSRASQVVKDTIGGSKT